MTTYYIDTSVSSGGDGSSGDPWDGIEAARLYFTSNQTLSDDVTIICSAPTGVADIGTSSNWTYPVVGAYSLSLKPASGHSAVPEGWSTSKYRITDFLNFSSNCFTLIEGIQISSDDSWDGAINFLSAASAKTCKISGCRIVGGANVYGVHIANANFTVTIENTIIDAPLAGMRASSGTLIANNVVVVDATKGFDTPSGATGTFKNCAAIGCGTDFGTGGTISADYCAGEDSYGTNSILADSGNWANEFNAYATGDYRVLDSGNLYHGGVAVSGLTTDMVGTSWGTPPSVGAVEYVALADIDVTGVSLKGASDIHLGHNVTLHETVLPENATDDGVSWSSSNTGVATVSGGVVTPISEGSCDITVTTDDGSFTASLTITVQSMTGVTLATSLNRADVLTAVGSASENEVVLLPAGTSSVDWTSAIVINKILTIRGLGGEDTTLKQASGATSGFFDFDVDDYRLSQIGFSTTVDQGDALIVCDGAGWRVDHCKFVNTSGAIIEGVTATSDTGTHPTGLIDNNRLFDCRLLVLGDLDLMAPEIWYEDTELGTDNAVFMEDNYLKFTIFANAVDSNYGSRYVFRYNTVIDAYIEAHSAQAALTRGSKAWEIYENDISQSSQTIYRPFSLRGGTGVVFNNTLTGSYTVEKIGLDNVRSNWRIDDPTNPGVADGDHPWDKNSGIVSSSGYPCRDQIGRGPDVTEAPSDADETTILPDQASEPVYAWGNTLNSSPLTMDVIGTTASEADIVEDRDYYNLENTSYSPFIYPHPLRNEGESGNGASVGRHLFFGNSNLFGRFLT